MNMMNFYVGEQKKICDEIKAWSKHALEVKNDNFNGLPACPFAKQSWNSGRVQVVLGEGGIWADLVDLIKNFDDTYDVIMEELRK